MNLETIYDIMEGIDKKYIFAYTKYNKRIIKKYFFFWKEK